MFEPYITFQHPATVFSQLNQWVNWPKIKLTIPVIYIFNKVQKPSIYEKVNLSRNIYRINVVSMMFAPLDVNSSDKL